MNKLKKTMKKIEDAMAAASFAEEGEFETAKEILKGQQKVLLTLTGKESDKKSFKYAFNICKRIGADIEILCVSHFSDTATLLEQFQSEFRKEGINYKIFHESGCLKEAIINHTEKRADIQFVVIESESGLNIECTKDDLSLSEQWDRLKCPLVIVSEATI